MEHPVGQARRMIARPIARCLMALPQSYSDTAAWREALKGEKHQGQLRWRENALEAASIVEESRIIARRQGNIELANRAALPVTIRYRFQTGDLQERLAAAEQLERMLPPLCKVTDRRRRHAGQAHSKVIVIRWAIQRSLCDANEQPHYGDALVRTQSK